jgi:xanthosine utilization system XapX-like protein
MKYLRWLLSLFTGMIVGIILHYTLYRIGLPVEPFIYLAF